MMSMNDSSEELKNLYELNVKISNALNTIKIDSNSGLLNMGNIPQILGDFFCAEYCAIGLCSDEKYFIDSRQWIRCANCSESQIKERMSYLLDSKVTKIPIVGSLIGSILTFTSDRYNYKDNGYCGTYEFLESFLKFPILNNDAYRKALPTGRKKDLIVLGLYSRGMDGNKILIGYIQLINKLYPFKPENEIIQGTGFIQEDLTKLKTIALSIELKLDNYLKNEELTDISKDEAIIKKLINKDVDKPESVYDEILEYLTTEYPFRLASFWFPFWNGYEKTDIVRKRDNQKYLPKDINQIKIVLRRVKVSKKIELGIDAEQLEKNFSVNIKGQNLSDHTFGNFVQKKFIDNPDENNRYCVFDEGNKVWGDESDCLKTDKAILVPIYRTNLDGYTENDRNKAIHLMGILYLKYNTDDLVKNIGISKRLDLFAKNLSVVFEKIMFERRYKQIEKLKDSLFDITSHNIDDFFKKIVKLVQENMHCGICSLFLTNTADDNLELVASTAEEFLVQKDGEQKIFNFQKDHHDGEGYQSLKAYSIGTAYKKDNQYRSLTLPILEGYTCVNFDDSGNGHPDYSDHMFYEITSEIKWHHSYLAVPLSKVEEKSVYGVIRCINKNDDNSVLYNSFTQSDKNYLIMIGGILSRFIELARFNLHKQQQYSIIVHDFNSPLSIISSNVNNIERRMSVIESLNNDIDSKLNESESLMKNLTQDYGYSIILNKLEGNLAKIYEDNLEIKRKLFAESKEISNSRDTSVKVLLETQRELSVGINDSLKSMKDYLQDSDILGKNVIVNIKKFAVKETIQKIADYYRLQAQYDKKVDIVCKIDKMPNLLIDEKLFWRVIDNLIKNAVKYSLDYGGSIEVKFIGTELMKFEDSTVIYWDVIEISNFGIPINNPDKIFEYGYREENAKRRDQSGSGIGLAAVKQCMKLMNGDVVLYRQQRPVKFRLFFPSTPTTKSH